MRPFLPRPCALCVRPPEAGRGASFTPFGGERLREFARGFYLSKEWRRTRAYIVARDHGLCVKCGRPGEIVHHKEHLTPENINTPEIALGENNLELWPGSRRRKRRDRPRPRRAERAKKNDVTRAHYGRIAALCGVSRKEALLMPPGELFDMWELWLRARGKKAVQDD